MKHNNKAEEEEFLINEDGTSLLMRDTTPSKYISIKWYDSWSNLNCTVLLNAMTIRWIYFLGSSLYDRFFKEYCGPFSFEAIVLIYW